MAEKVIVKSASSDLDGAQFENAATEATLKRLVDLLEKQKTGAGPSVSSMAKQAKEQGINPKAIKETEANLSELGQTSNSSSSKIDKLGKSSDDASKRNSGFGDSLKFLSSGPLKLLGDGFSELTSSLLESMQSFKTTGQVGASFNGSLLEMNKAAASAGMSVQDYSEFVKKNSDLMAAFGGTTTEGAKRMGELAKNFRQSDVGQQMQALGIGTESVNGALADYMKLQAGQGRLTKKSNEEIIKGAGDYLKNLSELSRLTGESVDKLSQQIAADERDARVQALVGRMSADEAEAFRLQMAKLNAISPKLAEAFKDGMIGLGDNQVWNQLSSLSPKMRQLAEDMKNGRISSDQFNSAMAELGPEMEKKLGDMSSASEISTEEFSKMRAILVEVNKTAKANADQAKYLATEEGKNYSSFTKALMTAKDNLDALWGKIKTAFFESDVFKRITGVIDWLGKGLLDLKDPIFKFTKTVLDNVLPVLDTIAGVISDTVSSIFKFVSPYIPVIGKLLSDIGSVLSDTVKSIISFVKPYIPVIGQMFSDAAAAIKNTIGNIVDLVKPYIPEVKQMFSDLGKVLVDTFTGIKNFVTPLIPVVGKFLSNLGNSLVDLTKDIISFIKPYIPMVGGLFSDLGKVIKDNFQPAMNALGSVVTGTGRIFSEVLIPIVKNLYDDFVSVGKALIDFLTPSVNSVSSGFSSLFPSLDSTIKTLKDWSPVIVGLIEGFIAYKGIMMAVQGAQAIWAGVQLAWATVTSVASVAWAIVSGAGALALGAFNLAVGLATVVVGALGSPIIAIIAAVVALGVAFKSLYDSGWTLETAFGAIKGGFNRFVLMLDDVIDGLLRTLNKVTFGALGIDEKELEKRQAANQKKRDILDEEAQARDTKRADVRKERGTEDNLLNFSGKKPEDKKPEQPQQTGALQPTTPDKKDAFADFKDMGSIIAQLAAQQKEGTKGVDTNTNATAQINARLSELMKTMDTGTLSQEQLREALIQKSSQDARLSDLQIGAIENTAKNNQEAAAKLTDEQKNQINAFKEGKISQDQFSVLLNSLPKEFRDSVEQAKKEAVGRLEPKASITVKDAPSESLLEQLKQMNIAPIKPPAELKTPDQTMAPQPPKDYGVIQAEAAKQAALEGKNTVEQIQAGQKAVEEAKAADAKEASTNQLVTLNSMNDELNKLTAIMTALLDLQHQQVDAQKDLVNVTKGRYSPI